MSVLIVEDEPSWQKIISYSLKHNSLGLNIHARFVRSAEDALQELYTKRHFDLILSDYFIQGKIQGLSLWRICKQKYPQIPFIIISGASVSQLRSVDKDAQVWPTFIKKPYSPKTLDSVIQIYVNLFDKVAA